MNDHYNDERLAKADQRPIDLNELIAHLADQQAHFSRHIDRLWDDLEPRRLAALLSAHGQNADRLGRLLRDRRAIYGERDEQVPGLLAQTREKLKKFENDESPFVPLGQEQEDDPSPLPAVDLQVDIDDVIADLADKQARLLQLLDRLWSDPDAEHLDRLLAVYSHNTARLGRLLRDRRAIYGERDEQVPQLVAQTMEKLKKYEDYEPPLVPPDQDDDPSPPPTVDLQVDIDDVIADLADKQARLLQLLDRLWSDPDAEHLDRLLAVYSHNTARLGRLLRHRTAIYGPPADMISLAIDRALDRLSEEWGVDL